MAESIRVGSAAVALGYTVLAIPFVISGTDLGDLFVAGLAGLLLLSLGGAAIARGIVTNVDSGLSRLLLAACGPAVPMAPPVLALLARSGTPPWPLLGGFWLLGALPSVLVELGQSA
jgi:hypothetical protein